MRAIASKDDLKSFTRSLNTEICRVWEHWNVLRGINKSYSEYWLEMNESGQFWRIAVRALQDVIIVRLAALVDPKDDVVSMPNFLRLLERQMDPKTSVIDAKQQKNLSCANIDDDIDAVDKGELVIKKVRKLRNKIVAHRDMSIVVREATQELPELPDGEIEGLIMMLHNMIWKYCPIVGATIVVLSFPGENDYKSLFKLLRIGFKVEHERRLG